MQTVDFHEAETHWSALLDQVAKGQQITITRDGISVAMLVPPPGEQKTNVRETIQEMFDLRKGQRLEGLSVRELIDEGRR